MSSSKQPDDDEKLRRFYDDLRRERLQTHRSYRDRALSILPHVCAVCGREFAGKTLRELTVHHKDHNHDNNPADGSNWELLCVYCHDNEHQRLLEADAGGGISAEAAQPPSSVHKPFADLKSLLKK